MYNDSFRSPHFGGYKVHLAMGTAFVADVSEPGKLLSTRTNARKATPVISSLFMRLSESERKALAALPGYTGKSVQVCLDQLTSLNT
jgi:hypothetical protein